MDSYCLHSTVQFPKRFHNNSASNIDSTFTNTFKFNKITVYMWINCMQDDDAQIIVLHNITILNVENHFYFTRKFNTSSVLEFNIQLT